MADWIKKALTQKRIQRGRLILEPPNESLVIIVRFAILMTLIFSGLELAHILLLGSWSSEVFSAISGLAGTISGIFVGKKG
jgi:hypothetical protein